MLTASSRRVFVLAEPLRQGAKYEYAQSLQALGELEREQGLPTAEDRIAQAQMELIAILDGDDQNDKDS